MHTMQAYQVLILKIDREVLIMELIKWMMAKAKKEM